MRSELAPACTAPGASGASATEHISPRVLGSPGDSRTRLWVPGSGIGEDARRRLAASARRASPCLVTTSHGTFTDTTACELSSFQAASCTETMLRLLPRDARRVVIWCGCDGGGVVPVASAGAHIVCLLGHHKLLCSPAGLAYCNDVPSP